LLVALKELYVKKGLIRKELLNNYEMAMDVRHEADYGLSYSEESAELVIHAAEDLHFLAKEMLKMTD